MADITAERRAELLRLAEAANGPAVTPHQRLEFDDAATPDNFLALLDMADRTEAAEAEAARLRDEVSRLTANYTGGDQDAQARAWYAVWKALETAGMLSFVGSSLRGRGRACEFVAHLAAERDRLRTELEAYRKSGAAVRAIIDAAEQVAASCAWCRNASAGRAATCSLCYLLKDALANPGLAVFREATS